MSIYRCDDLCLSNEDLALRIQDGDPQAAPLLLSQNEGYLTMLAASYCAQFSQDFLVDDLKQEGALALLDAARRYDPSMGTKLLTYATPLLRRPCGTAPPKVLFLCRSRWTVTTSCARWHFSMPHTSRRPKQIFCPPFKRSWKSPPK